MRAMQRGNEIAVEYRSGPLPDADTLAKYEAISPGAAGRIITMAESQQQHRIAMEAQALPLAFANQTRGQRFGLIIGVAGIGAALWLGLDGSEIAAGVIGGATIVSLVSVFVLGRRDTGE